MNNKLLEMIKEYREKGDFIGEISEQYIKKAQMRLEVKFPLEYKEFVKELGSGGICGVDVLGVEGEEYASVVESTERNRKSGLPKNYLVIEEVDEFVYCLNTVDKYNVVRWDDVSKLEIERYSTFDDYLEDSFQEAIDNCD
ncbi:MULTISPECIES: SMI1/KNR4 family protein [Virgibacillus]|uniref:SMI1 / KNR4 family protein n=1 Tax=Virgibacillus massiliensis TaxID=1462526 RepID=A0A024Q6A9_9BACI|nr:MULTISPECIES: SMI1/KNR4 family protein [Virgibacillus]EQB38510.1 hypothetical protein M948_07965 [Virgibacillus sp. CM-4]MYL41214.1 SMI1/KNR4 family protein [Virgibacillus massiliensis]CDQ37979.1 SMI1 / KNR4 family protein [Virgibacillus massiliensis]